MRSAKEDERYANAMPKKWQRNYKEDTKKGQCSANPVQKEVTKKRRRNN